MIDELVALFGGKSLPIVAHLIDSGKLSPDCSRPRPYRHPASGDPSARGWGGGPTPGGDMRIGNMPLKLIIMMLTAASEGAIFAGPRWASPPIARSGEWPNRS